MGVDQAGQDGRRRERQLNNVRISFRENLVAAPNRDDQLVLNQNSAVHNALTDRASQY
jgi:hypothetical protein